MIRKIARLFVIKTRFEAYMIIYALALGATPGRVCRMVLDYAVHVMLVGLLPGVFVAAVGSRLLEASIVRLMPNEITTWIVVPIGILMLGIVAALLPAWRASRIDPQTALRDL